eukprot:TRINITY_DN1356_c0_g1_i1.p1 TRINITY_DN1356_c0_g1~~TRINITY_DN1356_c0_g1_i1.p1  ORF type:complete len:286 (-),score=47.63 TRINITY_DN1356_c0_g1_i1:85-942(-)
MSKFLCLYQKRQQEVLSSYFHAAREAENYRYKEWNAAIKIQSFWRGCLLRKILQGFHDNATTIQRVFRGYLARCDFTKMQLERERQLRLDYFTKAACNVQRIFRGFYSRKYIHNFYGRKKYLMEVYSRGEQLRIDQQAQLQRAMDEQENAQKAATLAKFKDETGRMHHVISTKSIPGVFHPDRVKVVVNDSPIEHHFKQNRKLVKKPLKNNTDTFSSEDENEVSRKFNESGVTLPPINSPKSNTHKKNNSGNSTNNTDIKSPVKKGTLPSISNSPRPNRREIGVS